MRRNGKFTALFGRIAEYVYTVLLKPKWIREISNKVLLKLVPEYISLDSVKIACNPSDSVLSVALRFGIYEPFEQSVFKEYCSSRKIILDVGANVGIYSAIAASAIGPQGKIIAIEPDPESFSYLKKTVLANRFTTVDCINVAVGNSEAQANIFQGKHNKADGRLYDPEGGRNAVPVTVTTIDKILLSHSVNEVDLIKMDIQGSEGLAWQGMSTLLKTSNRPLTIFMEFWPWGLSRMGTNPVHFMKEIVDQKFVIKQIDELKREILTISDPIAFIASLESLQYNSPTMQRSHHNLILTRT